MSSLQEVRAITKKRKREEAMGSDAEVPKPDAAKHKRLPAFLLKKELDAQKLRETSTKREVPAFLRSP